MTYWEFAWPIYAGCALVVGLFLFADWRCSRPANNEIEAFVCWSMQFIRVRGACLCLHWCFHRECLLFAHTDEKPCEPS